MFIYNFFLFSNSEIRGGGKMRKKDDTLRNTLLTAAQKIADTGGIDKINIRTIAQKCGVATGTVYNYFCNKDEILLALTESYWHNALQQMEYAVSANSFCGQIQEIFTFLLKHINHSAGMLMGSLGSAESAGYSRMESAQSELKAVLLQYMEQDPNIHSNIWNASFTKEQFINFIMINLMTLLKSPNPDIDFFILILNRIIY